MSALSSAFAAARSLRARKIWRRRELDLRRRRMVDRLGDQLCASSPCCALMSAIAISAWRARRFRNARRHLIAPAPRRPSSRYDFT